MEMMIATTTAANPPVATNTRSGVENNQDFAAALNEMSMETVTAEMKADSDQTLSIKETLKALVMANSIPAGAIAEPVLIVDQESMKSELMKLASKLMGLLDELSEEEQASLLQNNELQAWMHQANELLLQLFQVMPQPQADSTQSSETTWTEGRILELLSTATLPKDTVDGIAQLMKSQTDPSVKSLQAFQQVLTQLHKLVTEHTGKSEHADLEKSASAREGLITVESSQKPAILVQAIGSKQMLTQQTAAIIQQMQREQGIVPDPVIAVDSQESERVNTNFSNLLQTGESLKPSAGVESSAKPEQLTMTSRQFVEQMSQFMFKNMKITQMAGLTEAQITMNPEHLGKVDVKISLQNGQLMAQFIANSTAGKEMLENQMNQLRQALQAQGLQVEKLEVTQSENAQTTMFQDQRQQHTFKEQHSNNQSRSNRNADDMAEDFTATIEDATTVRKLAYGNEFNVTA
ncbi:hypothetical protein SY83_16045 [Paenibacillus swuensis]|uniref:Flagellar hook-length control protein-like C-terminal domain-containing protein n=1 Tax=Paenibacillus swuensis TaxID=1178515 RepID=A0A172TKN9_9BACL|nr:flagellar hook-length control protein FliK [Paenibacillus swuensis]ANE47542.1 hypothetical protein SY83_16045 [Paenibacillus swuensis]